jgi:peptidoglycan/xylan/chitin deacetylase (PgdA/CDA1 family)
MILENSTELNFNSKRILDFSGSELVHPENAILALPDSIINSGKEIRSEVLDRKVYNLTVPLEKGWLINIWRNNWPVGTLYANESKDHLFPIELVYDTNKLRVAVWNEFQELVHSDQYEIVYTNPVVELLRKSITRGNKKDRKLSLTFDGGSSTSGTEIILEALKEYNIKTTMFITGQFVEKYPDAVMGMVDAGHEIGNHTYNHPHLTTYEINGKHESLDGVDQNYVREQLAKTDSIFYSLTKKHMAPLWRAPYGEYNQSILDVAAEAGYMHVRWTPGFDTFDWVQDIESPIYKTAQEVMQEIIEKDDNGENLNGAILLMHLGSHRIQDRVFEIVPNLIEELQSRGYSLVPVSNLLRP